MGGRLEYGNDGSIALYINNDLQFDSKDEQIYHEGLVLPALALASLRIRKSLKVLIVGGGDGFVARELFKSEHVGSVELVDYDPQILHYAAANFADINRDSLSDSRLTINVRDAWDFVSESVKSGRLFDLIIVDLTVPDDAESAKFHSIDWYKRLAGILSDSGVLAINGISALSTPAAFWCVTNGIVKANLHVLPYHVQIPSFAEKGYGQDWAFYLASNRKILPDEFDELKLIENRVFIKDVRHMRTLFEFPEELFDLQTKSVPFFAGSDILLQYFNHISTISYSDNHKSSFLFDFDNADIPQADTGRNFLPASIRNALGEIDFTSADAEAVLNDVIKMMPSLQNHCSAELIEEFVEHPASFLEGIDLYGLVNKLLQRAKELPEYLVGELQLLREKLEDWAGDHLSLFALGRRVITVLTVIILIGNLLYPDSVYGKGEHHAANHNGVYGGNAGGRREGRWVNGQWVNDPYWNNEIIRRNPNVIKERTPAPAEIINVPQNKQKKPNIPNTSGYLPGTSSQSAYLAIAERNAEAEKNRLIEKKREIIRQKEVLEKELEDYLTEQKEIVSFGMRKVEKTEAVRKLRLSIQKANNQIDHIDEQIAHIPVMVEMAKMAFSNLQSFEGLNDESV